MPRPIKARPLTASRSDWLESYLAVRHSPIPRHPGLLRSIVFSLLRRLRGMDPVGTRDLEILLHDLAAREHHRETFSLWYVEKPLADKVVKDMHTIVAMLAFGKSSSRSGHHQAVIRKQKDLLYWKLESLPPFPFAARQSVTPMEWLGTHEQAITSLLSVFLCQCKYPPSLTKKIKPSDLGSCRNPGRLISLLLSGLHGISIGYVENLLKASRTPR